MEFFGNLFDFVVNLDKHMAEFMQSYGPLTYAILFLVIFCETGLVVTPFLPGDSLIFIIGTLSVAGGFNLWISMAVLIIAALAGDNVNYQIGKALGPRLFRKDNVRFFNKKNLERTHAFYEKNGKKFIIMARFVPIVRTFAPFVAGMGRMTFRNFLSFSVIGAIVWVCLFLFAGYFLGKTFEDDLEYLIIGILVLTSIPGIVTWIRERRRNRLEKLKNTVLAVKPET